MSSRTVHVPQGSWMDLAAAASPALVPGKNYAIEWEERTIAYMRLTYTATAPDEARGTKVFARNDPRVPPAFFTVPQDPARIWIKPVEKDIIADIRPTDPTGDGSVGP